MILAHKIALDPNNKQQREAQREGAKKKAAHKTEARKEYMRQYRVRNAEILAEKDREYRSRPEVVARRKAAETTERRKLQKSEWHRMNRERNAELLASKNKDWYKKNANKVSKQRRDRYAKDHAYKLSVLLRNRLNLAIKNKSKCGSAVKLLGCSIDFAISYIEKQFDTGMSWDNWGEWHIDHIRPLSSFDLEDPAQLATACHYSNLRPLWASDNLRKGGKFMAVSPQNTSKICSACGTVRKEMPLSVRQWTCPDCGANHDRDLNAARNLATYAASSVVSACGEEGSGARRKASVKPASMKQEVSGRFSQE